MSRRAEIAMAADEVAAFIADQRVVTCATLGHDGWPHLMPLWFVLRDGECWAWTYAKSQKVRNLERDPRCTLQFETGDSYDQLRGVMLKCETEIARELDAVAGVGAEIAERYGGVALDDGARGAILAQAAKRVALRFRVRGTASWDHRKLGGGY
ncbi:MAG TPA: pyridoxamine 5'-phosphate oxidase family protein [Solirubrobacteraceae bacterium]|nr:pyridoxamine 5'-phosphate oxidase family protein [Solirubrobacteraceae bacterium]